MKVSRSLGLVGALLLILLAALIFLRPRLFNEPQALSRHGADQRPSPASQPASKAALSGPSSESRTAEAKGEAGFVASPGGRRPRAERRPPVLAVLAIDRSTDEPLAEAAVALHETQRAGGKSEYREEITALDGTARFELLSPGHYYVSVSCQGYLIGGEPFRFDPAQGDVIKKISLIPAYTVRGRVLNQSGRFVSQAEVSFSAPGEPLVVVESGPQGDFEVVLSRGRYRVEAAKHPHLPAELYPVEVGPKQAQEIQLVIQEQAERVVLSGRVLDLQGRPVPLARISLTDLSRPARESSGKSAPSSFLGVAAADSEGRFRLETVLRPRVEAEVEAHAYEPLHQSFALEGNLEKEFRLKAYPTFVVRAVTAGGEELPIDSGQGFAGLEVVGVSADGRQVTGPVYLPGRSPEFSARPLFYASEYPFEIYAFDKAGKHGITGRIQVGAYRPEITLVADQPAQLHGHVTDRQGNPVRHFAVAYRSGPVQATRVFESEKGEFELLKLPEGPCTIQILSPDHEDYSAELVLQRRNPAFLEAVVARRQGAGL